MNGWKMIDQVSGLLLDTNEKRAVRERKGFLEKFYEGACGIFSILIIDFV